MYFQSDVINSWNEKFRFEQKWTIKSRYENPFQEMWNVLDIRFRIEGEIKNIEQNISNIISKFCRMIIKSMHGCLKSVHILMQEKK